MSDEKMIEAIITHTRQLQQQGNRYEAIEILQTKWYARILFELCKKSPQRFGELKKDIPEIANVVLTSALKNLAERNLVTREQFNEIPPHVEYSLTERGKGMLPIFYEMIRWEEKYQ